MKDIDNVVIDENTTADTVEVVDTVENIEEVVEQTDAQVTIEGKEEAEEKAPTVEEKEEKTEPQEAVEGNTAQQEEVVEEKEVSDTAEEEVVVEKIVEEKDEVVAEQPEVAVEKIVEEKDEEEEVAEQHIDSDVNWDEVPDEEVEDYQELMEEYGLGHLTENGSLEEYISDNDDDSEEKADERGISGIFDVYGREIIADVFENRLRMNVNFVKVVYSRLKNLLRSYGVERKFVGKEEIFTKGDSKVVFGIEGDTLTVAVKGKKAIVVKKDAKGASYKKATTAIEDWCADNGCVKDAEYVPTAYAERYAHNPDAILRGHEDIAPDELDYSSVDYDPVEDELNKTMEELLADRPKEIEEEEENLANLTQKVSDIKGATAISEPIVYFYNVGLNDESKPAYIGVQQVLNDKYLGKMLPQMFFAVAERSDRIITLNLLAIEHTAQVADTDDRIYVTQASPVLLTKEESLATLLKVAKTEKGNLVLAFDCAMLESLGEKGKNALRTLAQSGIKIMIDNTENAGLKILTEYSVDYLRFDGRYYKEEDEKKTAHLDIVVGYAKTQGIPTCVLYSDTVKGTRYFISHGINIIEGDIVGVPVRLVNNAVKSAKRLPKG